MTRLNILIVLAVLASCLALVRSAYDSRRLFAELDRADNEAHQLALDYQRLQVERQAQATPMRVERSARDKLQMRNATPAITQYVSEAPLTGAEGVAP
jgi:cell division protein FtsL